MTKMNVADVCPCMLVDEPIYAPGSNRLLLQHGVTLTPKMIEVLQSCMVEQVSVSLPDSIFVGPRETLAGMLDNFFTTKITAISPERPEGNLNDRMMTVSRQVLGILRRVIQDEDILNLCIEIKLAHNKKLFYPAIHSCLHSALVAGAMELSEQEIYNVAAGALLQNLGLCEMSYLLDLPYRNPVEETLWREHCMYGYYFAREHGVSADIANLIRCHHEQFNGTGYPDRLVANVIPMGAKIINLCSQYDEMVFAMQMQPYQAAEIFFSEGDGLYDSRVINAFIANIPLYPLGSIVRLSDKRVGVVVNIRKNMGAQPVVRVCYNRFNKSFRDTTIVDLGEADGLFIEELLI